jgi:hypothetical protein
MNEQMPPAVTGPVEPTVRPLPPERAAFVDWLRAYAGGGEHWRGNVLMGEHDIALALWKDRQREIDRLQAKFAALRIAHQCMAPACPSNCSDCNHALSSAQVLEYAKRYAWLRERDLNTLHEGGVFAGRTPHNVVLNGADLDEAIDAGMLPAA